MRHLPTSTEIAVAKAEEANTLKILLLSYDCKTLEELQQKIKAMLQA